MYKALEIVRNLLDNIIHNNHLDTIHLQYIFITLCSNLKFGNHQYVIKLEDIKQSLLILLLLF